ncbi:translation initiation factor IF-2-like [Coturnix japonica]|uniref:translation initiation factor IF-2-like n=1 Tax=Coturnix japonica TaxID=93934 RepID=UPI0013A5E454|nr:translation initiation factor IF-2-like [Coturnix japonica]
MGVGLAGKTRQIRDRRRFPAARDTRPYIGPCGAQPGHPPERGSRGHSGLSAAAASRKRSGERRWHRDPEPARGAADKEALRPPHYGPEPPGLRTPRRAPLRHGSPPRTGRLRQKDGAPLINRRWLRFSMGRRGARRRGLSGLGRGAEPRPGRPGVPGCGAAGSVRWGRGVTRCKGASPSCPRLRPPLERCQGWERGSLPLSRCHSTGGGRC